MKLHYYINEIAELEVKIEQSEQNDAIVQSLIGKQEKFDQLTKEISGFKIDIENNTKLDMLIEQKTELESDLPMEKSRHEELEEEIKQLNEQAVLSYSQAKETKLQLISELGEMRSKIQNQLTELKANAEGANKQDIVHAVTATKSGVIHYVNP